MARERARERARADRRRRDDERDVQLLKGAAAHEYSAGRVSPTLGSPLSGKRHMTDREGRRCAALPSSSSTTSGRFSRVSIIIRRREQRGLK